MSRLKLFIPLAIFAILALLFWRGLSIDPSDMPSALIDKPVPVFSLPALAESSLELLTQDLFKGQVSLINVWATWCVSCRVEHPYLLTLAAEGVAIVGVNYKDDSVAARQWLQDLGDPYQVNIVDAKGYLGLDLGVFGAPETYLVDTEGVIRYKHVGVVDARVWREILQPVVAHLQRR
tara:strand:- start:3815 stop:4348 length:534 start_codon:yes stop_codon:yes gene_type:complete